MQRSLVIGLLCLLGQYAQANSASVMSCQYEVFNKKSLDVVLSGHVVVPAPIEMSIQLADATLQITTVEESYYEEMYGAFKSVKGSKKVKTNLTSDSGFVFSSKTSFGTVKCKRSNTSYYIQLEPSIFVTGQLSASLGRMLGKETLYEALAKGTLCIGGSTYAAAQMFKSDIYRFRVEAGSISYDLNGVSFTRVETKCVKPDPDSDYGNGCLQYEEVIRQSVTIPAC